MMDPWLRLAAIAWCVCWVSGYVAHKVYRPAPSDLHLPRLIQILCGRPRSDGTLSAAGIYGQLFGLLLAVLALLVALNVLNRTGFATFLVGGGVVFSIWFFWRIRDDKRQ